MSSTNNQFSAADSALGYLYQARLGLLWALKRLKDSSDFVVSLETLDDVAFETKGQPDEGERFDRLKCWRRFQLSTPEVHGQGGGMTVEPF
jgi:hypothetical protein